MFRCQFYFTLYSGECKLSEEGGEYTGKVSTTNSGLTCQRWDANIPHYNLYTNANLFPDGDQRENFCRYYYIHGFGTN